MSPKPASPKTPIAACIPAQQASIHPSFFDALANSAFVRESQLVQSPKRPGATAPWPFSAASYWRKIKAGLLPKPIKLSDRVSVQIVSECRAISAAWAAGKSDAEIRELVKALHATRAEPAQA